MADPRCDLAGFSASVRELDRTVAERRQTPRPIGDCRRRPGWNPSVWPGVIGFGAINNGSKAVTRRTFPDPELDAVAVSALDEARSLPAGAEPTEALKKAGQLRNAADSYRQVFSSETSKADQS